MPELVFDPQIPFSRAGSYMALSTSRLRAPEGVEGLFIRDISGWRGWNWNAAFRVELVRDGKILAPEITATPSVLTLRVDGGEAEFCFQDVDVLRVRVRGAALRLVHYTDADRPLMTMPGRTWRTPQFAFTAFSGDAAAEGSNQVPFAIVNGGVPVEMLFTLSSRDDQWAEAALQSCEEPWHGPPPAKPFDQCIAEVRREFEKFAAAAPAGPAQWQDARLLAAYVNWSSIVRPRGLFRRPGMLMSKDSMRNIWSWDHCFNAIALAGGMPDLAWDQLMVLFDHQHPQGHLPDSINDDRLEWKCVKPPIHGWALGQMVRAGLELTDARAAEIYGPLVRWTEFWLTCRDSDGDGVPEYEHGNESGWDNATVFDVGFPVESPDCAAFLVLQMEQLAVLARQLGRDSEASVWQTRAAEMLERMLAHFWDGRQFRVLRSGDHAEGQGQSLLRYLPLLLGRRLPQTVRDILIADLKQPGLFLTEYGLATESPQSLLYVKDGYWRGPIWAPPMLMMADGLSDCGEGAFAAELARRFCNTCAREGFYENFEALTGRGLRDPAYTWTSSIFLILASLYGR